jgi:hypothetical protein
MQRPKRLMWPVSPPRLTRPRPTKPTKPRLMKLMMRPEADETDEAIVADEIKANVIDKIIAAN